MAGWPTVPPWRRAPAWTRSWWAAGPTGWPQPSCWPGPAIGPADRGRSHSGGRLPLGRAHAARLHSRPLQRGPPAGPKLSLLLATSARASRPALDRAAGAARASARRRRRPSCFAISTRRRAAWDRTPVHTWISSPPWSARWDLIIGELTGPFRIPLDSRKLVAAARFGLHAIQPLTALARRFKTPAARALLAGCGAHSMLGLSELLTGGFGLIFLASGHTVGWPIPAGGSQRIADALAGHLKELGGTIVTSRPVGSIDELPPSRAVLLDITPRQVLEIAGGRLASWRGSGRYLRQLRRFRYGPGAFKLDLALDGPIPWRDPEVLRSATVHVGGTFEEIVAAEAAVAGRPGPGAAVRSARSVVALRPIASPRGTPHRLGVLSRPERLHRGYDRENPGPDRTLRPRISRADPRDLAPGAGRPRAVQPELHRRRYRRRADRSPSSTPARPGGRTRTARRTPASSSARHRHRPAPACMVSAGGTRRGRRSGRCSVGDRAAPAGTGDTGWRTGSPRRITGWPGW